MTIFKIVLTLLILLQTIQIITSTAININNDIQKMLITLFIILLSMIEPTIALLTTILITINIKNNNIEKMFTPLYNYDLKNILETIDVEKPNSNKTQQPTKKPQPAKKPQLTKKQNMNMKKDTECDKDLIISESMLHNIQNNVFNEKNMSKYPNETNDENINIQGVFRTINGYSSASF